jgi:hypothetical protein
MFNSLEDELKRDEQQTSTTTGPGFRVEIIRSAEVTDLAVAATKWYSETPSSDLALTVDFAVRGRRFHLTARMRNCEQLQKLLRSLTASPTVGAA